MSRLAFIGGEGYAKEAAAIARQCGHEVVGYVALCEGVLNAPFWGGVDQLLALRARFDAVHIAFGVVDRNGAATRARVMQWIIDHELPATALISPHAVVCEGAEVADGALVSHGAVLSVDCTIGGFSIINAGAVIGHDSLICSNVTVAPMAFVAGQVQVGDNSLLGPGSLTLQGLRIGRNSVVGVGATVLQNLADGTTVMPRLARAPSRG